MAMATLCCQALAQPVLLPLHWHGVSMASLSSTQVVALLSQSDICPCVASNGSFLLARTQLCKGGGALPTSTTTTTARLGALLLH